MKQIQHFIIDGNIKEEAILIEDKELLNQMTSVLRYRVGDKCIVLDGKGMKANGEITEINRKFAKLNLTGHEECKRSEQKIRLFIAISKKPSTFELIVQKACELGVDEIIPIISNRTQVDDLRKTDRLKFIIKEAAEQCERPFLPELSESISLEEFVKNPPDGLILAGDAWDYDLKLIDSERSNLVNIVIGPEGGLTKDELQMIREIGGKIFLLGEYILRMETAAIAAISVVRFR